MATHLPNSNQKNRLSDPGQRNLSKFLVLTTTSYFLLSLWATLQFVDMQREVLLGLLHKNDPTTDY